MATASPFGPKVFIPTKYQPQALAALRQREIAQAMHEAELARIKAPPPPQMPVSAMNAASDVVVASPSSTENIFREAPAVRFEPPVETAFSVLDNEKEKILSSSTGGAKTVRGKKSGKKRKSVKAKGKAKPKAKGRPKAKKRRKKAAKKSVL